MEYTRTPVVVANARPSDKARSVEPCLQFRKMVKSFPSRQTISLILAHCIKRRDEVSRRFVRS